MAGLTDGAIRNERLRELLHYDLATGVFTWRTRTGRSAAGKAAGFAGTAGYWDISVDRRTYRAHRLAWLYVTGDWPAADVDHKNRDRGDNRWANLRAATRSQNNANMAVRSTHGFKGATPVNGRWMAQTKYNGRQIYLGLFDTPEEAHAAYMAAAERLWGNFARAA